jgi:uncharacterized protein
VRAEGLGLLGLARRAGALIQGTDAVRGAVKAGEAGLVVFASDAADGQLDKVRGVLKHHPVPVRWARSRDVLGGAVGSGPLTVLAVKKGSFAEPLARSLPDRREPAEAGQKESDSNAGC